VDAAIEFVAADFPLPYRSWEMASARTYAVRQINSTVVEKILESTDLAVRFRDLVADAREASRRIEKAVRETFGNKEIEAIDVLRPIFVRNKAAYMIGRVRCGDRVMPLLMSLLNGEMGLEVDAVLHTREEVSIVFSFARWYFHADVENPRAVIGFLHSILPRKRVAELYISLGYNKHGKTELYNDLMTTIASTDEQFIIAPGKRGLVMSVFTLPSYEFVFKVIRDVFPTQKSVTPDEVRQRYREVLQHDRVGRLVDFQEFEHLEFPRNLFSPELLDELLDSASASIETEKDNLIIDHLYVGRRVTPLDLYLRDASSAQAEAAVIDWGFTLKELAAANIFAGDMLLKNFGVTRHGRVVFYDYDEISPVTDCRFRRIPRPRSDWDELAPGPWFSVGTDDVFPQELRSFTLLSKRLEAVFDEFHSDLFEVDFWKAMQDRNRRGEVIDFFPYDDRSRLRPSVNTTTHYSLQAH
jgi:isocitrate dehydrogenase kinase/phosphatase